MLSAFHEILSGHVLQLDKPENLFRGISPEGLSTPKNILLFGRSHPQELQPREDHRYQHRRFVLIINLKTTGSMAVDGQWHRLAPGNALLVFPHQVHAYKNMKESSLCWLFLTFEMDDPLPLEVLRGKVLSFSGSPYFEIWLDQALIAWKNRKGNAVILAHLAALLLCALQKLATIKEPRGSTALLSPADHSADLLLPAVHEIIEHRSPDCRVKDLAGYLKMSESHLRAQFRKQTGQSLGHYLLHMRISRAAAMLAGTKLRVGEIADRCGFDSLYSFSRSFRRVTGASPRNYRKDAAASPLRK